MNHTLLVEDCLSKETFTAPSRLFLTPPAQVWDQVLRRRVSREADHALEKLGHAIEHLTDELVSSDRSAAADPAVLEAIRILMRLNSEVYHACPVVKSRKWSVAGLLGCLFR